MPSAGLSISEGPLRGEEPQVVTHITHLRCLGSWQKTGAVVTRSYLLCATYGKVSDIPDLEWDFIIVGGGTAGSVVAGRLTENHKFSVLLIEAGPTNEGALETIVPGLQFWLNNTWFDWNLTTVPQHGLNGRSVKFERGHVLGGSSSVNGMVYTRGPSSDFDRFAGVTEDIGWSWNEIQKYIKKHEKFEPPADNHGIKGQYDPTVHSTDGNVPITLPRFLYPEMDSAIARAGEELGGAFRFNLDMNSGVPLGLGWVQSTIGHDGTRSSAATSYLDARTRSRKNLHIVTDTRVTRVLRTPGTRGLVLRTVEIKYSQDSEAVLLTASKEVILAGGAIGTPHILLHSGIDDRQDLEALNIPTVLHNPSVGRNLSDHPVVPTISGIMPSSIDVGPWGNLVFDPALRQQALELWNTNRTGPFVARIPPSNLIAWTRLPDDSPIIKEFGDPSSGANSAHIELFIQTTSSLFLNAITLNTPTSRGSVSIRSDNPFDDPLIDPRFFSSKFDLPAIREGVKQAINFTRARTWEGIITGPLGPLANTTTDMELEEFIRNAGISGLHPVSTASMSPKNADWGVVDPDLRVKVSGLRIVDASVMPFVPSAHTQAPIYIVAERAADMIRSAWR